MVFNNRNLSHKTLKDGALGRKKLVAGYPGEWDQCPPPPAACPTYPPHPFSFPPSPPPSHNFPSSTHHPPPFSHNHVLFFIILLLFLLLQEVWKAYRLSILACRTGTGMSAYRPGLLLPPSSKIIIGLRLFTDYKILTGFTGITRHRCSDCLINCNTSEKCVIHCKQV